MNRAVRTAAAVMAAGAAITILGSLLFLFAAGGPAGQATGGPRLDPRAVIASGGVAVFGVVLALVGLAFYVLAPAFWSPERARSDYGSHRVVLASSLLAVVLGNVLASLYFIPATFLSPGPAVAGSDPMGQMLSPAGIAVAAVSLDVALLAIVFLRVVRPGAISWSAMGLTIHGLGRRLITGVLVGLLLFGASSVLEWLLDQAGVHQTQSSMFQSVTRASLKDFGLILLAGAVIAPIAEEIYFRGYVFRAYADQKGPGRAFLYSSALFAVVHLNLPALLPIFAMGLLLSAVYYRTGSIIPAIVAHVMNNSVAFTLLYLGLA